MKDTEKINPKTIGISRMPVEDIVNLIVEESMNSLNAVKNVEDKISFMVQFLYDKIINGGKIIYVGAGTSGRIAAQDVIELYPTYGLDANTFDYIMVGGRKALYQSVENSEDNKKQASIDLKRRNLKKMTF